MSGSAYVVDQGQPEAKSAGSYDNDDATKEPPAFMTGFRRTRSQRDDERIKKQTSFAAAASVAQNARSFVSKFVARKGGNDDEDDDDENGPKPSKFNPKLATGAKGFVGAVAAHLQESEARKAKLRAQRAHQMAVKGIYNKKLATTPTVAPPGAPRFFHTLPTTLPQSYFADVAGKADEAQLPNKAIGGGFVASPKAQRGGFDEVTSSPGAPQEYSTYWECDEVTKDMVFALKIAHTKGLYGRATFVQNERVQSLKDVPLKELVQGDTYWRAWRSAVDAFMTTHATTALNGRYMLGSNKGRFIVVGNSSVYDALEGVLVHVWRSSVAAKDFVTGWRRVWQAVFESRLDGITCPFSAMYRIQGSFVSVTALVPIEPGFRSHVTNLTPTDIWGTHGRACANANTKLSPLTEDSDSPVEVTSVAVKSSLKRFCHAMCIDTPPPLHLGLDGRYYILDVRHVLQPTFADPSIRQRPRLELLLQMRDLRGLLGPDGIVGPLPPHIDRYGEEDGGIRPLMTAGLLSNPLAFVKRIAARRCAIDMMRTMAELDMDTPLTVETVLDKNLVSQQCHRYGLNLCFLPVLIEAALTATIPPGIIAEHHRNRLGALVADACRVEMLSRTLKELAVMDLNYGVTASTPINDVGRRIHVPNRIASLVVAKDPSFLQDQVMPRLRQKYHGANPDLYIDPATTTAGRLLRNLIFHLGAELDGEQKRFTHYCPISATYAMVMRPPRTTELYISKQYTELDAEVPLMWRRWALTPTTSPVRHSAFIHSSFLTLLCRASEKYGLVRESAEDCLADFDAHPYLQAEVLAVAAEAALIAARDTALLKTYVATLKELPRTGSEDAPIFGVKLLNAALLTSKTQLATTAADALVRIEYATPTIHSATASFAISVCESMLISEADPEPLDRYLGFQREHVAQVRNAGLNRAVHALIHTTAVLIAANPGTAAYGSKAAVEFAREALRMQMEGLGPRHRCTCVATYHLIILALRERLLSNIPAVERYHGLAVRSHESLIQADLKRISGMTRGEKSMELISRVVNVLRDAGDANSSLLLQQQRQSLIQGELVELPPQDELAATQESAIGGTGSLARAPSGILASSQRNGSFAGSPTRAKMDMEDVDVVDEENTMSASLHSPMQNSNDNGEVVSAMHSPTAGFQSKSSEGNLLKEPSSLRLSHVNLRVDDQAEDL
jgi:hypothetical protein